MANLQRINKHWHIFFRLAGKPFKKSLKTTSKREAENILGIVEETIRLIESGRITLPKTKDLEAIKLFVLTGGKVIENVANIFSNGCPPLQKVIDEYFASYTTGKEESTIAGERIHANHLLRFVSPEKPFDEIDGHCLQEYVNTRLTESGRRGKTLSPETVKKEFRTFNQIWKMARSRSYSDHSMPKVQFGNCDEKMRFMTWEEIEAIVERGGLSNYEQQTYWDCLFLDEARIVELLDDVKQVANHSFIHAAFCMAAYTGARRSEIIRSQIEDWDINNGVVNIRGRKDSRRKRISFRSVPIHDQLRVAMTSWFECHPGGPYTISVPANLAHSRSKTTLPSAMSADQAQSYFVDTLRFTKWSVLRGWHVLRHSFCSNCARRGVPDQTIDAWMGHQGNEAVKKRYRHLFPSDQKEYMARLFQ